MGTAERRNELIRVLCRRRHDTIKNLSYQFGVSERTILRDIEALSLTEPIYTQCGRYGGGVYIDKEYIPDRMYMNDNELAVLKKLMRQAHDRSVCDLSEREYSLLDSIISQYTKPQKGTNL